MVAVWIVGFSFLAVGLLFCVPRYIKFIRCKGKTKGIMTQIQRGIGTGNQPTRASYTYVVDGIRYAKSPGCTGNGIFHLGQECDVRYNISNPSQSYLHRTGQIINGLTGTLSSLAGLRVLGSGLPPVQLL